jgi:hypothetical protein
VQHRDVRLSRQDRMLELSIFAGKKKPHPFMDAAFFMRLEKV